MADFDDDDELDFGMPSEDEEEDELDFGMTEAPAQPAPAPREKSMMDRAFDSVLALTDGFGMSHVGEAAGLVADGAAALGIMPPTEGGYAPSMEAQTQEANRANPYANVAGKAAMGVGTAMLAPQTVAGQAGMGFMRGLMSEYGDSHDLGRAVTAGGVDAALSGGMQRMIQPTAQRQGAALQRSLTRDGNPDAYHALDEAAGGMNQQGLAHQGMGKLMDRARQHGGGQIDIETLPQAASRSIQQARQNPAAARALDGKFGARASDIARDPVGANWVGSGNAVGRLNHARNQMAGGNPQVQQALDSLAQDQILARATVPGEKGLLEQIANAPTTMGGISKYFLENLDKAALSPTVRESMTGMAGVAATGAGQVAPEVGNIGRGVVDAVRNQMSAAEPYLQMTSTAHAQEPELEEPRADSESMDWAIKAALTGGKTGLSPQDEQELTRAVVDGNTQKLATLNFQFQMKYPGFQRAVEDQLRSLTGDVY